VTTTLDEFVIMISVVIFIMIDADMIGVDDKKNVGWLIVGLILFSVVKNFSIVLYFGII